MGRMMRSHRLWRLHALTAALLTLVGVAICNVSVAQTSSLDDIVSVAERQAIRAALVHYESTDEAADALGLSPTTLWRKMKKLEIDNPHRRR